MLAELEKQLQLLIKTDAHEDAIAAQQKLVNDYKARTNASAAIGKAELEQIRAEALDGAKRHAKALETHAEGHQLALADLARQRLETEDANTIAIINAKRRRLVAEEEINKRAVEVNNSIISFMENKGLVTDFKSSNVGKFLSDMPGAFRSVAIAMGSAIQPQNLFAAGAQQMISATKDLFTAFDSQQAKLSELTATTGEYNDMLYDIQEQNKSFNVGVEEAGEAIGELHREMKAFSTMGSANQQMLATTAAQLSGIGLEARAAAQQMDNMVMVLGMSAKATNDASLELVSLGSELGFSADMISDEFNASMKELSGYGPDAIDVFKGMAAAAKATGIEIESLIGIVEGMDTFEGAAEAAGKLNAVLGGGVLDTNALLMADHDDKIRMIKESVAASGKSFDAMNRFEKKLIANAAGISDMTEANKLFGSSSEAFDKFGKAANAASAESANLEERAQAATSFSDKLQRLGEAFAVAFMPILEFAHGAANLILELSDATGGFLIPALVGLVGVFVLASKAAAINNMIMGIGTGLQAARLAVTGGLGAAQAFLAGTTAAQGSAAIVAAPANVGFAASLSAILGPLIPLTPLIFGLGMAMLGLGLAIAAPFIAIAAIVWSLKELFIVMLEAPAAISAAVVGLMQFIGVAAAGLIVLSTALAISAAIMLPAAGAMMTIAPALTVFGAALLSASLPMVAIAGSFHLLGMALQQFENVSFEMLAVAGTAIVGFLVTMALAAPMTAKSAIVGLTLLSFGLGLLLFGKGLQEFNNITGTAMIMAAVGVGAFLLAMNFLTPFTVGALLVGGSLIAFGLGLLLFGKGLQEFNNVGVGAMFLAAGSLLVFALALIPIGIVLAIAGAMVGVTLGLIGAALWIFAQALILFNEVGIEGVVLALIVLGAMAWGLMAISAPLNLAAWMVGGALALLGMSLWLIGSALTSLQETSIGVLFELASALLLIGTVGFAAAFGLAMISNSLWGIALSLMWLPIEKLYAFNAFGNAIEKINNNKEGLVELNSMFETIGSMGIESIEIMNALSWSIWKVAFALSAIPENKAIAFNMAMQGYTEAMKAVANLSPEQVVYAEKVVSTAGEYQRIQAEMRMPDEDSFIQALTKVFGGDDSGSGSGKGQDIVMKVNGREFARAVDVAINKKHNLKLD